MQVGVVRLWQDGKLVPRWQRNRLHYVYGELRFEESRDPDFRRTLRVAHLFDYTAAGGYIDVIHPLTDAIVISIIGDTMSISGIERYDIFASVAQTWIVKMFEPDRRGAAS